jgi:hypothetical protein
MEHEVFFGTSAMSTGRHSFKHNDAARLIRATEAAGLKVKGVTLDGSKLTVLVDEPTTGMALDAETVASKRIEQMKQRGKARG